MDGASNNDTMMTELAWWLDAHDIAFDPANRKIACHSHVIDLTSGCVIDSVTKAGDEEDVLVEMPSMLSSKMEMPSKAIRSSSSNNYSFYNLCKRDGIQFTTCSTVSARCDLCVTIIF